MKPLILSFPKSGLNLVRILTEKYTQYKTPDDGSRDFGTAKYNYGAKKKDFAFVRSHNINKFGFCPAFLEYKQKDISKLILILRDYHYAYYLGNIENSVFGISFEDYILNIKYFCNSKLPKKVFYYEDLISSIDPHLEIFNFLELEHTYNEEPWESVNKWATEKFLDIKRDYKKVNNSPKTYSDKIKTESLKSLKNNLTSEEIKLLGRYI